MMLLYSTMLKVSIGFILKIQLTEHEKAIFVTWISQRLYAVEVSQYCDFFFFFFDKQNWLNRRF